MDASDYNKTGGPAFPLALDAKTEEHADGITVRDYFAAAAITGMTGNTGNCSATALAKAAYELADAMLEARRR